MTPIGEPACMKCARYRRNEPVTCDAFPAPGEIPESIWTGGNDHTKPVPGDHGLLFVLQYTPTHQADGLEP